MDYRYLQAFSILGDTGSFKETVAVMGISASQLSKNMDKLQTEMGMKLFSTEGRRQVLNDEGRRFLPVAREIVRLQNEYSERTRNLTGSEKEQLTIGLLPMASVYNVAAEIGLFEDLNPEIDVNVIQESGDTKMKYLLDIGQIDLAFTTNRQYLEDRKRDFRPFARDYYKLVLPPDYPVNGRTCIPLDELRDENFLLMPDYTAQYRETVKACRESGFIPLIKGYYTQADMIMNLVQRGRGVSLLMQKAMSRFASVPGIQIVDPDPQMPIDMIVVCDREKERCAAIRKFLRFVERRNKTAPEEGVS